MRLSETPYPQSWLAQFTEQDRETAARLIDEIMLVSRDELHRGITALLDDVMRQRGDSTRPLALFAEREVTDTDGTVDPIFPGTEHGRAIGHGVQPVFANPANQEVGSEGPLANLITDYCRLRRDVALPHPGPDALRERRVGHIVLVTDFIGSGNRICRMLDAFRRVATIQSWRSYRFIDFFVVAYAGTAMGLEVVRSHQLRPTVLSVVGCPTIKETFIGAELTAVTSLCERYGSGGHRSHGFRNSGALIAFAHGMPNNAPLLLHKKHKKWLPLFSNRSTLGADLAFPKDAAESVAERVTRLLRIKNAHKNLIRAQGNRWIHTMLVLASIERCCRSAHSISANTRLPITVVEEILRCTLVTGWTSRRYALTRLGREELMRLRRRRSKRPVLPSSDVPFYYPTQLRVR